MSSPACRGGGARGARDAGGAGGRQLMSTAVNAVLTATRWLPAEELKRHADLYRECGQLHRRCSQLVTRLRGVLLHMERKALDVDELTVCVDEIVSVSGTLATLRAAVSASQAGASSAVVAFKSQWWRSRVWQDRASLLHMLLALLTQALAHCSHLPDWPGWKGILRMVAIYNEMLSVGSSGDANIVGVCRNTCPTLQHPLRKVSLTRILQLLAQQRAEPCCHQLVDGLLASYAPPQEQPSCAVTETPASPVSSQDSTDSPEYRGHPQRRLEDDAEDNSSMEIFRALTHHLSPPHGTGAKSALTPVASDSACLNSHPGASRFGSQGRNDSNGHPDLSGVERLLRTEDALLAGLLHAAARHAPHLLGTDGIKANKASEVKRPRGCVKRRALEYYQQLLWGEVGCVVEHVLLWWGWACPNGLSGQPIGAESPECCHHLRTWLIKLTKSPALPALCLGALQSLVDSLGVHITSTSWDALFRRSIVSAGFQHTRPSAATLQREPGPDDPSGARGTLTGRLFCSTLADLVDLSNACEGDGPASSAPPLDEIESLPLVEQIPLLHRLDHSVHTLRLWTAARARLLAGSWTIAGFFLVSQRDVDNCLTELNRLKLRDHGELPTTASVHVTVCSKMRAKLVSEVRENVSKLKRVPDESIAVLAHVCRTVSLATLHMVFPEPRYWRRSGSVPEFATGYVEVYLERVLRPVLTASCLVSGSVQHTVGGLVLRILCECWLDHIYAHRIKFSEWGALQLLTDFGAVPTWLCERVSLPADVRDKLLGHEVLRRCEGVGRLLLRRPGERVDMGAPTPASHQGQSHASQTQHDSDIMPAEMYVPNQEQWLELRAPRAHGLCPATLCCIISTR